MGSDIDTQRSVFFTGAVTHRGWSDVTAAAASLALHPLDESPAPDPAFARKVRKISRRTASTIRGADEATALRRSVTALRAYRDLASKHGETHYMTRYDETLRAVLDSHEAMAARRQLSAAQPALPPALLTPGTAAPVSSPRRRRLGTIASVAAGVLTVAVIIGVGVFVLLSSNDSEPDVLGVTETTATTSTTTTTTTTTVAPEPVALAWEVDQCVTFQEISVVLAGCDSPDVAGRIDAVVELPTDPLSPEEVAELQEALAAAGFEPGPADGLVGPRTLEATAAANESLGLPEASDPRATLVSLRYSAATGAAADTAALPLRVEFAAVCDDRPYVESPDGLLCLETAGG